MQKLIYTVVLLILVPVILSSCIKEETDLPATGASIGFSLSVPETNTPVTRGLNAAKENYVKTIDMFLFKQGQGQGFAKHIYIDNVDNTGNPTFNAILPSGTFDIVFIANASLEVSSILSSLSEGDGIGDLQQLLTISSDVKWNTTENSYTPIPMWGQKLGVSLSGGNTVSGIHMTRMLSRINISVSTSDFTLQEVYLCNPYKQAYIMPAKENWELSDGKPIAKKPTLDDSWTRTTHKFDYTNISNNKVENEIYTFEVPAGDPDDISNNTFLIVGGLYNGDKTYYRIDFASQDSQSGEITYLPLLRNHKYEVFITKVIGKGASSISLAEQYKPSNLVANLVVINENEMQYYVFDDQYFIAADDRELTVPFEEMVHSLKIRTDHPLGWIAVCSDSDTDPNAGSSWLTLTGTSGSHGVSTIEYRVRENSGSTERSSYIYITAGNITAKIKIIQDLNIGSIGNTTYSNVYVGAFWRYNQTGERLIRIKNSNITGSWTATVIDGKEWIILDNKISDDPNIGTNMSADMNNQNNDKTYQVSGSATSISGTSSAGEVYLRIGLKDEIDKNDSPRYGRVVLTFTYNGAVGKSIIYIRQGEKDDYVMRPEDLRSNGAQCNSGTIPRSYARKWSPFNLTSPNTFLGGNSVYSHPSLSVREAAFTDYPSQAGTLFQWSNRVFQRRAYHPVNPGPGVIINGWNYNDVVKEVWAMTSLYHETCPYGYKRPGDGPIHDFVLTPGFYDSEVRQSLWRDPFPSTGFGYNTNNMLFGYYADGFFDRRHDNTANNNSAGDGFYIAYRGTLFFNPLNHASIFMPAAGARDPNDGKLVVAGTNGGYWTSTTQKQNPNDESLCMAWALIIYMEDTKINIYGNRLSDGFSIRCVVAE